MELQKLIKLLLATNNFVSLPGLGSFIVTYKPAQLSADSQTFKPPKEFIRFDTSRTFNDEALENALVDSYGFSKTDSGVMILPISCSTPAWCILSNDVIVSILKR